MRVILGEILQNICVDAMSSPISKKRGTNSLEKKHEIIIAYDNQLEKNKNSLARQFGMDTTNIRRTIDSKSTILKAVQNGFSPKRKRSWGGN